jgi:hypothetical protein
MCQLQVLQLKMLPLPRPLLTVAGRAADFALGRPLPSQPRLAPAPAVDSTLRITMKCTVRHTLPQVGVALCKILCSASGAAHDSRAGFLDYIDREVTDYLKARQ